MYIKIQAKQQTDKRYFLFGQKENERKKEKKRAMNSCLHAHSIRFTHTIFLLARAYISCKILQSQYIHIYIFPLLILFDIKMCLFLFLFAR